MNPAVVALILELIPQLIALAKKPDATIADVEAAFASLKPYEEYGIDESKASDAPKQNPT